MKKIKTSLSLNADQLDRLKRLAAKDRSSVSQIVDQMLEHILPVLEIDDSKFERLIASLIQALNATATPAIPAIAFPQPEGPEAAPASRPSSKKVPPASGLRPPTSGLKDQPAPRSSARKTAAPEAR